MTFIVPIIIFFLFALIFFGKNINEWQDNQFNSTAKIIICVIAVLGAGIIGAIKADFLYVYLIFGLWIFLFTLGMTLLVGLIDLFNKTRFYKVPCLLTIMVIVTYGVVILIKEG